MSISLVTKLASDENGQPVNAIEFFRDRYVSEAASVVFRLKEEKKKNNAIRINDIELAIVRAGVSMCSYDDSESTSIYFLNLLMNLNLLFPEANHQIIFDGLIKHVSITSSHNNLFIVREYAKKWNLEFEIKDKEVDQASNKVKIAAVRIFSMKDH